MNGKRKETFIGQENINRLTEARLIGEEIDRLKLRRILQEELRRARYAGSWFKPFDLWCAGWQFLFAVVLACLILLGAQALN